MKYIGFLIGFLIAASSAYAQQQPQLNPLEQTLNQEWGALQLSQQHLSTAIVKIVEDWKKDKETLATERVYWSSYVKGLYGEKNQSMANPK